MTIIRKTHHLRHLLNSQEDGQDTFDHKKRVDSEVDSWTLMDAST